MTQATPTILNRKASHLYYIEDRYEVGVMLQGSEVKSIRNGTISLGEAWVDITDSMELWLVGAHIDEYHEANRFNHIPARRRKLLAHKHEILKMRKATDLKGLTIVPLKLYFKDSYVKLEIGICRGKDQRDKRQDLIGKDASREMARTLKSMRR